jgi:hypothetical protein
VGERAGGLHIRYATDKLFKVIISIIVLYGPSNSKACRRISPSYILWARSRDSRAKEMVIQPDTFHVLNRHRPTQAYVAGQEGRLLIQPSCADIFCVPMMQCLKNDREIRAWGSRQGFFKSTRTRIFCFSVTSKLCCWRD